MNMDQTTGDMSTFYAYLGIRPTYVSRPIPNATAAAHDEWSYRSVEFVGRPLSH